MPRKKGTGVPSSSKTGTPVSAKDADWGGFINVRMTDDDKAKFALWEAENGRSLWTAFAELLGKGMKFSLAYDADGDFYLATFTAAGADLIGIDLRCCLTARAPEWERSISLLIYKHEVMAEGDWGKYRPKSQTFDRLG